MRRLALLLCAALLSGCAATPAAAPEDRLPRATLPGLRAQDRPVDLAAVKGPAVVSVFASWCGPCRHELPQFEAFSRSHRGVRVLGVDWEDPNRAGALALIRATGVTFPIVVDAEPVIRTQVLPQLFLIDRQGRIAFKEYVQIRSAAQLASLVRQHLGGVTG